MSMTSITVYGLQVRLLSFYSLFLMRVWRNRLTHNVESVGFITNMRVRVPLPAPFFIGSVSQVGLRAAVLKTVCGKTRVGSSPTASAIFDGILWQSCRMAV